jgi:cell division protein FtsX
MKRIYFVMLALSISLVSGLFLVYSNAVDLLADQGDPKKMLVYVNSPEQLNNSSELIQLLRKDRRIENYAIQSKQEILSSFISSFPEYAQGISFSEEIVSMIPQIVEVSFRSAQDSRALASSLQAAPGVSEVQSHFHWLEKLVTLKSISLNFVIMLFSFFAGVLIVISVLMAHKVVLNEKEKLQIYSFCGASQKQIFKILFSRFYLVSLLGVVTGIVFSYGFYSFIKMKIAALDVDRLLINRIHFLSPLEIVTLTATFVLIVYATITVSAKLALKEVWNED